MPECAKTHLQQCRISKIFRGRTPGLPGEDPPGRGGKGQGKGREGGKGEGRGGDGKGRGREDPHCHPQD